MSELVEGTRLDIVSTATAVSRVRIPRSPPSEYIWPVGQVVKTPPFHGGNTGSNPVRVIFDLGGLAQLGERLPYKQERSEEHTSELQSRFDLVCRLLLAKTK